MVHSNTSGIPLLTFCFALWPYDRYTCMKQTTDL